MGRTYLPVGYRSIQWLCVFLLTFLGIAFFLFGHRHSFSDHVIQMGRLFPSPFANENGSYPMEPILLSAHADAKLLIYNRIPKTGGTSIVHLVYQLYQANKVAVAFLNITHDRHSLTLSNRLLLVRDLSARDYSRPLLLHGHFRYLNFKQCGSVVQPLYINMIRDPLDRLVSYYYFLRFGDDFRPYLIRRRMSNLVQQSQSFDECVVAKGYDCHPNKLWLQVPFFCGHAAYCQVPGSRMALETAKRRVTEDYVLVGITEAFDDFVLLLEKIFPQFFNGALTLLRGSNGWHMRRTINKSPINESTRSYFKSNPVWQVEQEFYDFVRDEFWSMRNALVRGSPVDTHTNGTESPLSWSRQQLLYQRIRPSEGE
ncbi:unnamed protein product [Dicrocoelium dendriticum]|nr:unnamed protein product [Dicrocoelium dendriticum]